MAIVKALVALVAIALAGASLAPASAGARSDDAAPGHVRPRVGLADRLVGARAVAGAGHLGSGLRRGRLASDLASPRP